MLSTLDNREADDLEVTALYPSPPVPSLSLPVPTISIVSPRR